MNNNYLFHTLAFQLVELLAATGIVFWAVRVARMRPDGPVARWLHHRDRIWFALMLLLLPEIVSRVLWFHWMGRPAVRGPNGGAEILVAGIFLTLFRGAIYGAAGCLFASPAKKTERFSVWLALAVTVVLIVLEFGISMVLAPFRFPRGNNLTIVLAAAVLLLAYLAWRASRNENSVLAQAAPGRNRANKGEHNPASAFLWLLVGLAPVPILLAVVSSRTPQPSLVIPLLIICPLCNLCGGIGCLGGIQNVAVRIILGLFLAVFFLGLSLFIAVFEACSHMGAI